MKLCEANTKLGTSMPGSLVMQLFGKHLSNLYEAGKEDQWKADICEIVYNVCGAMRTYGQISEKEVSQGMADVVAAANRDANRFLKGDTSLLQGNTSLKDT